MHVASNDTPAPPFPLNISTFSELLVSFSWRHLQEIQQHLDTQTLQYKVWLLRLNCSRKGLS